MHITKWHLVDANQSSIFMPISIKNLLIFTFYSRSTLFYCIKQYYLLTVYNRKQQPMHNMNKTIMWLNMTALEPPLGAYMTRGTIVWIPQTMTSHLWVAWVTVKSVQYVLDLLNESCWLPQPPFSVNEFSPLYTQRTMWLLLKLPKCFRLQSARSDWSAIIRSSSSYTLTVASFYWCSDVCALQITLVSLTTGAASTWKHAQHMYIGNAHSA